MKNGAQYGILWQTYNILLFMLTKIKVLCFNNCVLMENKKITELEVSIPQTVLAVEQICAVFSYYFSPHFYYSKGERHKAWELIFVSNGEVVVETPEYEKTIAKNHIFIHTPYEFHKIRANNTFCHVYIILFHCDCEKIYEIAGQILPADAVCADYIIRIMQEGETFLEGKNSSLFAPAKAAEFANGQAMKSLIELLLIKLLRSKDKKAAFPQETQPANMFFQRSLVSSVILYMQKNIRKDFTLADIAKNIGYSIPYICAVFKKIMNISIVNYSIKMRIDKAKSLIHENNLSLIQISEFLNYNNFQYFSNQFKKITGIAPSKYAAFAKLHNFQTGESADPTALN